MDIREEQREYYESVQSIVDEIVSNVKSGATDPDEAYDAVHESVDGDQWVIYTYRAKLVVAFISDNASAAYDEGMEIDHSDGINWSALAYFAMSADVRDRLQPALDEIGDEPEEDAD